MGLYEIDGVRVKNTPDSLRWEPPRFLGFDGDGAPSYAPNWTARLGFARTSIVQLQHWHAAMDGASHTIRLPHPITGRFTDFSGVYVRLPESTFSSRDTKNVSATGVDIAITGITLS